MSRDCQFEIETLMFRYASLIDQGDFPAVARLFSRGCIVGPDGSETRGYDAVLALYRASARIYPETGTPCTQHLTSNIMVEIDPDGSHAVADSRFTVFQSLPDFPLQPIIAGRYRDEFARVEGSWWFTKREMQPELLGDLSRHLLIDLPA